MGEAGCIIVGGIGPSTNVQPELLTEKGFKAMNVVSKIYAQSEFGASVYSYMWAEICREVIPHLKPTRYGHVAFDMMFFNRVLKSGYTGVLCLTEDGIVSDYHIRPILPEQARDKAIEANAADYVVKVIVIYRHGGEANENYDLSIYDVADVSPK